MKMSNAYIVEIKKILLTYIIFYHTTFLNNFFLCPENETL